MQPTYFINHSGGPCFFLDPGPMRDACSDLERHLRGFVDVLDERPKAILIGSGHWEEGRPTVNAGAAPALLYDYGGLSEHTHQLTTWPAPASRGWRTLRNSKPGDLASDNNQKCPTAVACNLQSASGSGPYRALSA